MRPIEIQSTISSGDMGLSIVVRILLKRGSFVSVDEWEARVLAFIGYYNQTAKPFKWTYQGKALTV